MKSYKKIIIILIIGVILTILGMTMGALWHSIYEWVLRKILTLTPTSLSHSLWKETPVPMYFTFHVFNLTNPKALYNSSKVKPNFVEMGPYVFREIDYKVNTVWNDNGTVTFERKKVWIFDESLSNGSLSDKVTNLNPIALTFAYALKHKRKDICRYADTILRSLSETLVFTKSVGVLLFEGYNDTLLTIAKKLNLTKIPFTKFGWFYGRNGSNTYDGTFNMLTGSSNLYNLGIVKKWNYRDRTDYYDSSCGMIGGTNGDLWPPLLNNKSVSIFINDICTSLDLSYENKTTFLGLTGRKYVGDDKMLDNGTKVPSRKCYCSKEGGCRPTGTLDISACKFGAPAFVSMPHFYLADKSYRDNITGMKPNKEKHEMSIIIEPTIGVPLQVKARLQVNLLLQPVHFMSTFENVKWAYVPMLWFTQEANLTDDYASKLKVVLIVPTLGLVTFFGIGGIGVLIIFIGFIIFIRQKQGEENQMLIAKQESNVTNEADA